LIPGLSTPPLSYTSYQYNIERGNGFFPVESEKLSVVVANDPSATSAINPAGATSAYTYSNDEFVTSMSGTSLQSMFSTRAPSGNAFAGIHFLADPFPVYNVHEKAGPLVYFNSDSYTRTFVPPTVTGGWVTTSNTFHSLNIYLPPSGDPKSGVARPYLTSQLNTTAGGYMWAEQATFQIISAGLDGSFGGVVAAGTGTGAGQVAIFPTGQFANSAGTPTGDKYEDSSSIYGTEKPQLDNITNFSIRTLEGEIP
jgi:hypothetical protein